VAGFDDGTSARHAKEDPIDYENPNACHNICDEPRHLVESQREWVECFYDFRECFSGDQNNAYQLTNEESSRINSFKISFSAWYWRWFTNRI